MSDLTKVAFRNVGRNKRRTLITILTVFIGVVVSVATRGLLNGLQDEIKSNLTRKIHGDLQIHREGYQDSLESNPYKLLIPDKLTAQSLKDPVLNSFSQAPRLRVMALLNHQKSQTTTPVAITGINSVKESLVCPRLATSIQSGSMLDSLREQPPARTEDDNLEEATGLQSNGFTNKEESTPSQLSPRAVGYQQIMITPSLQRGLGAEIGDEIVVLISDKDNMQQAIVAQLVGVIDVATPGAAARMAWMDLESLQRTLHIPGQATEIAFRTPEDRDIETMKTLLANSVAGDLVVETWKELGGFLRDAMALQDVIFTAIVAIMFAIVIAAIVNTSLMTVMERTREIGTLMALGYRRKHILSLFLTESAIIGGAGGLAGISFGVLLTFLTRIQGLQIKLPGQSVETVIYPNVPISFMVLIFTLAVASSLIAGLIPAYRASHLKPVEALSST